MILQEYSHLLNPLSPGYVTLDSVLTIPRSDLYEHMYLDICQVQAPGS